MDNWLKFPGKVYLSAPRCLKLVPVFRSEVIGAAAAPVHNVFILALKTNVLLDLKQIRTLNIDLRLYPIIHQHERCLVLVHVTCRFSSLGTFKIYILIVGLGFPLQLKWLQKIKQMLN